MTSTPEVSFRAAVPEDRDRILELRARCFADEDPEKRNPAFWDWEFQQSPSGPLRAFLAEAGDQLVAQFAFIPQSWMAEGERRPAAFAVDVMTDPSQRGRGISTRLQAFAIRETASVFAFGTALQIRPDVLNTTIRNGWTTRMKIPILLRPLSWRNLIRRVVGRATTAPAEDLGSVEPIDMEALASVAAECLASSEMYVHRSAELMAWRYQANPFWKYTISVRRSGGEIVAYLITRRLALRGWDVLAVVDVAWRRGHERDGRLLIRDALRRGAAAGIELAAALITKAHPAFPHLLRAGFLPGPHRFRFLVHDFGGETTELLHRASWALTWGDTDHL